MNVSIQRTILLAICALVGVGFLFSFLMDPLGMSPVMDARENLALAGDFADGDWPESPFYRAMLYPLLLSLPLAFGWEGAFPWAASVLGLGFHFLNAWLVGRLAGKLWGRGSAAWLAGVVYACYPVALFFSVQVLDVTPGITLFLLGLDQLAGVRPGRKMAWLRAGLFLGLAVLVRPNFLVVAPVALAAPFLLAARGRKFSSVSLVLLGLTAPLLLQGIVNLARSGEFRVLPWQGAFNLYAANRTGADGRYFEQSVLFRETEAGENTARRESEVLYRRAEGPDAALEPAAINRFWRERLFGEIRSDPAGWIGLMGRKIFYLFHNWEPYNNLSYTYHRERFPFLAWNPLGWTVLLLAAVSALGLAPTSVDRRLSWVLLGAFVCYGVGVLAFYVSARFRLPMAPLLAVASGGWAVAAGRMRKGVFPGRVRLGVAALLITLVLIVSLADFADAYDRRPYAQDEILLASAAFEVGEGAIAFRAASSALERVPDHPVAARLVLAGILVKTAQAGQPLSEEEYQIVRRALAVAPADSGPEAVVKGLMRWREGDPAEARRIWERADTELASALREASLPGGGRGPETEVAQRLLTAWVPDRYILEMGKSLSLEFQY